jgi:hypothetical protein
LSLKRKTLFLKARAQTLWEEEAAEEGGGAAAADGEDEE